MINPELLAQVNKTISPENKPLTPQLVVEHDGKRIVIVAFSDLDGTANDETIPERERPGTIIPALETLQSLEAQGVISGINTGRSFGEAQEYRGLLGIHGPIICEDGAVVIFPSNINVEVAKSLGAVEHNDQLAVVLSRVKKTHISGILTDAEAEMKAKRLITSPLVTTISSDAATIMRTVGHPDISSAALSADRLASGYVVDVTPEQETIISRIALEREVRTFGVPLHLIGTDAHKGHALKYINSHADRFFPEMNVQGILPIAFGNNVNDIAFMETCKEINDGIGVLVGKPGGGYFVDEAKIPSYVIKTHKPFGHGMKEGLPQVYSELNRRFNLNLK